MAGGGGEDAPCLVGEDAGNDQLRAGFHQLGDDREGLDQDGGEEVGDHDVVLLLRLPLEDVELLGFDAFHVVAGHVALGDLHREGIEIAGEDLAGPEFLGGDGQHAGAAAQIDAAPAGGAGLRDIDEDAEAGRGGGVVTGAEGHFRRQAEQVAAGVGLFEALEFLGIGGLGDQELVADLDRWWDGGTGAGPVGAGELADAAAELLGDRVGLFLGGAEDFEADRLAAFEDVHDEIRIAAEAVFPGIEPLGGGEFRPDEHAAGFKFQGGSAKCQSRPGGGEFYRQDAKDAK